MNTELPAIPERASALATQFEWLFWYITAWTTIGTLGVCLAIAVFCVAYRRKAGTGSTPRILGSHKLELGWTIVPLLIFLTFFAWGAIVYNSAVHVPEAPQEEVFVIGKQWMWKAQYSTGQRVIIGGNPRNMTAEEQDSIGSLVLPLDTSVRVTFISEDVIHDFGVPAFRQKIDVLPGRYVQTWYHPTKIGEYHVFCDQYCGTWHSLMVGKISVVSKDDFRKFKEGTLPAQGRKTLNGVDGSLAWEGQQLFGKLQCNTCHMPNAGIGTVHTHPRAPSLEGLYGRTVPLKGGGSVVADDAYIIESILNPRAKVVEGWEPIMPHYQGQVSAEDLIKVAAYIKSLKPGGMIPPNLKFPAPDGAPREPKANTSEGKQP